MRSRTDSASSLLPAISGFVDFESASGDRNIDFRREKLGHGLGAVPLDPADAFDKRGLKIHLH